MPQCSQYCNLSSDNKRRCGKRGNVGYGFHAETSALKAHPRETRGGGQRGRRFKLAYAILWGQDTGRQAGR